MRVGIRQSVAEARRTKVAQLLRRGFGQQEITRILAEPGPGQIINPETNEPYAIATIHRDVVEMRERWRAEIARDVGDHFAEHFEKLGELERNAWIQNDLRLVLDILREKAKLIGLYSPMKIEIDWRTEVVHMLIDGRIDLPMLEAEIKDDEILEGIIAQAHLLGYDEGSNGSEDEAIHRSETSTEIIEIDGL